MVTLEKLRELFAFDPDTGEIRRKVQRRRSAAGSIAGTRNAQGYIEIKIDGKTHQAHRLAWLMHYGVPAPEFLDHINRVRDDNRIENLRPATKAENGMNRTALANNKCGVKGCYFVPTAGKWRAQCRVHKKLFNLGYHATLEAARDAYNAFASKHFGAFFVPA